MKQTEEKMREFRIAESLLFAVIFVAAANALPAHGADSETMKQRRLLLTAIMVASLCLLVLGSAAIASETKSADEIAKELANPNNSLASLTFKNQFRWYEGDLPDADNQDNYTLLFQPVSPFKLGVTQTVAGTQFYSSGQPFRSCSISRHMM